MKKGTLVDPYNITKDTFEKVHWVMETIEYIYVI